MESIRNTLDKVNSNLQELKSKEQEESGEINVQIIIGNQLSDEELEENEKKNNEEIRRHLKKNGVKL